MSVKTGVETEPWQRPPFEAANQLAKTHGAYAQIASDELEGKEAKIYAALAADAPVREADGGLPAADTLTVKLLADTLCRLERIAAHIDEHGWDGRGRGSLLEHEGRLRSLSLDILKEMGMTPASRAKLGVDLGRTVDLAQRWAEESRAEEVEDAEVVDDG